jgi:hypothetical protein
MCTSVTGTDLKKKKVLSWGYEDVLLLVEAENTPAMALYKKMGYKEVFRDTDVKASKAVAYSGGSTALQTVKVSLYLFLLFLSHSSLSLISLSSLPLPASLSLPHSRAHSSLLTLSFFSWLFALPGHSHSLSHYIPPPLRCVSQE